MRHITLQSTTRLAILILLFNSQIGPALTPAQRKQLDIKLTIEGRPDHPIVYMTKADIARARANRDKCEWAKEAAAKLLREADQWANRSDEELVKLIPPAKACYAYGFSGCPVCGGTLAAWWGQGGVASLDDPGHIKCVNGHRLPDERHPDEGKGWTDAGGKKFFFVGTYHAFVIDTLTTATTKLVHAYALSGDEKYAQKAALLLDHLARIYPTSETGSWDYPSNPPSGRFNRPWYQVARTLIAYVNQYDILLIGKSLDAPSSSPGMTRRQNIEQNMLLNGAAYCYRQSVIHPALHNGQCDYIRGPLAVAAAMGIPEYVAWGADGPYSIRAMIANNVDRDGQYYETSALYSDHARYLYMDIAEILANYTDAAHPNGIKLAEDPVFRMFNLLPRTKLRAASHSPSLGDDAPNLKRVAATQRTDPRDLVTLEHLAALANDAKIDRALANASSSSRVARDASPIGADSDTARGDSKAGDWLLFHARDLPSGDSRNLPEETSRLFSQKGLAILRSGAGEDARAVTLRFGPTLNHGHLDEMNLNIYARGFEMSYDLGYVLGSTHTQVGWGKQTASHNLVMVDEKPQLQADGAGGALESFVSLPGVSIVRASNRGCYASQKVSAYERTVALIDVSPKLSYIVDVFRVAGGQKHDYIFHARGTDVQMEGVALSPPREGSLAGEKIDWGGRIGSDGDVSGVVGKEYWNPPPGNGFGFLMNPRSGRTKGDWSATWTVDDDAKDPARLRLTMLGDGTTDSEVVLCEAPGLYPHYPKAAYVLDRDVVDETNEPSIFVAVIEPYGEGRGIKNISMRPQTISELERRIELKIELADGRVDRVLWSTSRFAVARFDEKGLVEATAATDDDFDFARLTFNLPRTDGWTIAAVDYEKNILYTDAKLDAATLADQWIVVRNASYAQPSAYRVASVESVDGRTAIHLHPTRLTLGRAHIDSPPAGKTLRNIVPIEYAKSVTHHQTGFFRGKRLANPAGTATATIESIDRDGLAITVDHTNGFSAGDDLIIYDVYSGDSFSPIGWLQARRDREGRLQIRSSSPGATVTHAEK